MPTLFATALPTTEDREALIPDDAFARPVLSWTTDPTPTRIPSDPFPADTLPRTTELSPR